MNTAAIIAAAGRGSRAAGSATVPKQYCRLGGKAMLRHSLETFLRHPGIDRVLTVIGEADRKLYQAAAKGLNGKLLAPVPGGATRQESVFAGLRALQNAPPQNVLIHDAARPFVSARLIERVLEALKQHRACLAALPVADTLKYAEDGIVRRTVDRSRLWRAQTPQGFDFQTIFQAHERAAGLGLADFTDDASLAEWSGVEVAVVEGAVENWKVTTAEELLLARRLIEASSPYAFPVRTGTGFDVHAFAPGDHVMLCGVRIPHDRALKGHSDADAGLHALTDALLGAIGAGDIGMHFPPSDPQWREAPSRVFLSHAAQMIARSGGRIVNVDITVVCEEPKIGPYRDQMRETIAQILGIGTGFVSLKATTTEGLGFTGRREGIAAMASANVWLPGGEAEC